MIGRGVSFPVTYKCLEVYLQLVFLGFDMIDH